MKWEEKRLGHICEFISRGIAPKYVESGVEVINQKCIRHNIVDSTLCRFTDHNQRIPENRFLQYGDILVNSTGAGTLGRTAIYRERDKRITVDGHVTIVRASKKANGIYLGYLLFSNLAYLENLGCGSTNQLELSTKDLKRIKIQLPPLAIQNKIGEILSAYDAILENNNRRIELLEKAAQEIYKEWFVRLRFPGYKNVKFIGGIPSDWKVLKFDDIIQIIDGDRGKNYPKQDEFLEIGHCLFLNAGNVTKNGFDFSNNSFISKERDSLLKKGKLQREDIVMTTRGTVGNLAFYDRFIPFNNLRINSGMVIIRGKNRTISPKYLFYLLKSESIKKSISLYSSGSAQPQLPIKDMKKIKVALPTGELIEKFTERVSEIEDLLGNLRAKNLNLIRQRDLLLPRLMSGKLEVK